MAKRILLVDDEKNLIELLANRLQFFGYEVAVESNGYHALKKVQDFKPELIILDVKMPGPSGFYLCEYFKEQKETQTIPIIMMSGLNDEASKMEGLRSGANAYITKPVVPAILMEQIQRFIGKPDK